MRICNQCQNQMNEGYIIKVNTYGTPKIERGTSKPDGIKVAVCPNCGEVSLFVQKIQLPLSQIQNKQNI